ncbi:hypothetical protein GE253_10575 [Niveispirillum sp. SYP-B3756]|uniref:hypothetical protein n=1 Tax=Niveispirillum sp. SYP-B3756 TaxID=2662178 RepID=UPI0012919B2F|nr:hypothetical protein [Niveispirillum sp. SYP-B3756]MQP65785.1 hypothetical protein [Niveispirillum sp. SYP-B3756]
MMLRSLLALSVLLLPALSAAAADNVPAAQPSPACALAETYLLSFPVVQNGGPVVFSEEDQGGPREDGRLEWRDMGAEGAEPKPIAGPPNELISGLRAGGGASAIKHCANVRKLLDSKGIRYGEDAVNSGSSSNGALFKSAILGISLPVISKDGNEAVLVESFSAGMLLGRGNVTYLKRQADGKWQAIGEAMLWVS